MYMFSEKNNLADEHVYLVIVRRCKIDKVKQEKAFVGRERDMKYKINAAMMEQ